jgi:hypothetical protein
VASGSIAEFASPGLRVSVADNSTMQFSARAVNDEGTSGPCSSPITYVEDSMPGAVAITGIDPAGPANQNLPRVTGSAEADATVRLFANPSCQGPAAGGGTGAQLAAGLPVRVPDNATSAISAIAIDVAGNASPCSSPLSYTEDSRAPETKILDGPRRVSTVRRPAFRLHLTEPGSYPICKLDRHPAKRCTIFYRLEKLSLGRHRISIAAVDTAGNVDPTPAVRSWKVVRPKHHRHRPKRRRH